MTQVKCTASGCEYNDGNGNCTKDEIFISDAEYGEPICEDYED